MSDKDYRQTFGHHYSQRGEKIIHFLRGEIGCGLIEDQHFHTAVKSFQDLHFLPGPHRQILDQRVQVHIQIEPFLQILDDLYLLSQIHGQFLVNFCSQNDILQYGETGDLEKMLVNHTNMQIESIAWRGDGDFLAIQSDFA
jgi:hypothetical protein